MSIEKITLGAGCFWCVENIFKRIKGITNVVSGYADGNTAEPTYEQVCAGDTHHVEVVEITFDNTQIKLEDIFTVFFAIHDPTTLNRQGDDVGTQYRSAILYHNEAQKALAVNTLQAVNNANTFKNPTVTSVKAVNNFYSAESYHQDYVVNNPENRYCQLVVAKKIQKFLAEFSHLLKDEH